ncbi:MAG: GNAT family N-acetyltransferase [Planctomycetota bacterium]|nr:GNAT family N-acetyltransferase [Planctomycetota bacterium]MEC9048194.1 GNAT family N-acetyltransferase [Planctomycetota bacterium]
MTPPARTPWILRPIRPRDDADIERVIRDVMTEHRCSGPGFALHDGEVVEMSRSYRAARSGYFVVERGGAVCGGAGFAPLEGSADDDVCELRKMYFLPAARGEGVGRAMLALLLDEMRVAGFRRCYLETTSWMERAQRLYLQAGFTQQAAAEGATGHHGCDAFFSRLL